MPVSDDDVRYVARLSRLELTEEEVKTFAGQMKNILDHFNMLDEINTEKVKPLAHVQPLENVLREDKVEKNNLKNAVLNSAPQREKDFIKVPSVWEDE